jgi:hypothetical protein
MFITIPQCNGWKLHSLKGTAWPWSYGSWIYNYLCNQCLGHSLTCVHYVISDFESSGIKFWPRLFNRTNLYFSKYIYSSSWYLEYFFLIGFHMDTRLNGHFRNIPTMLDQSLTGTKIEFSFSVINRIWNTLQYGKFKPLE